MLPSPPGFPLPLLPLGRRGSSMRDRSLTCVLLPRPPPETFRNQQKTPNDRLKGGDGLLLGHDNRRLPQDRNGSRNTSSMPHPSPNRFPTPRVVPAARFSYPRLTNTTTTRPR